MKLIFATVQDEDADGVADALKSRNIALTRIGSTGGFLKQGNTTLLVGVADNLVEQVIAELRRNSERRRKFIPVAASSARSGEGFYNYIEVEVGGATVFVLDVEHFEQI